MGTALRHELLSIAEYLAGEEFAPRKREYLAGEVYPMPDSSARHNHITLDKGDKGEKGDKGDATL
ncbi:MAG: hypothetical protein Q8M09_08265 [Pseudomonadota bacterium]|nr:hypothetical protein [Pseudomonadota bacterium]MDP1904223.1 hypothetical protein [Pseudomonadota bacterium]